MHCGVLDFLLKLPQGFSVRDAAEHAAHMDDAIWMRMVTPVGRVDVLRAGRPREYDSQLPEDFASELVSFARRQYQTVCLDLSGKEVWNVSTSANRGGGEEAMARSMVTKAIKKAQKRPTCGI